MFSSPRRGVTHLSDGLPHCAMIDSQRIQRFSDVRVGQRESLSHGAKLMSAMHWITQPSVDVGRHAIDEHCDRYRRELSGQ